MPPKHRSALPWIIISIILLLGGGGWWWHHRQAMMATSDAMPGAVGGRTRGGGASGPASVVAATAGAADLRISRNAIGTVAALATVTVRTQIAGHLDRLLFTEGQIVQAGDLLAEIDARPFALAQAQYQGQLLRDQAQLAQAERDQVSYRTLVEQDSLAKQQLDTQVALVAQLQGAIATDTAQIDAAKLNQAYCRITAPIAGRLGLRQVDAGNYVTASDAGGIVTITQIKPVGVVFALPEADLPLVLPRLRASEALAVVILDHDGTTRLASGTVASIDNAIDPSTGTVKLRASLPNDDERLFPNQFVNVRLDVERHHADVAIPTAAVQHGPRGAFVWLVIEGKANQRQVQLGIQSGDRVEIMDGVAAGDQVVIDGVDRLREGTPVTATAADTTGPTRPDGRKPRVGGEAKGPGGGGQGGDNQGSWRKRKADGTPPAGGDGESPRPPAGR